VRVGIEATSLLGSRSGVGNYTGRLLAALIADNPEWDFLLYSNRTLEPLEPSLAPATRVTSRFPWKRLLWMQGSLPALIRRTEPDLCHFPNAMAPLYQERPFVVTIHDASLFLYSQFHPRTRILSIRLMLPFVARRAAAVITVSQHARRELIRILGLAPEKVHVVYEAAGGEFRPVTGEQQLEALRRKYNLPEHFLLYVGTLEPRKNLIRMVHSLREVRRRGHPHHLVLVGANGWYQTLLRREVARLELDDVVHFMGYLPTADLPGLFSLATLFVFPSLYEGFGLPPLEAMASGAPVLSSNRSSLPEILGDAAHLVDPENEDDLTEGLAILLADSERRRWLAERGLARARAFSWRQAARETAAIYRKVLQAEPDGVPVAGDDQPLQDATSDPH
jgi:glycosyltransferase involved in cell wall biosynthesis